MKDTQQFNVESYQDGYQDGYEAGTSDDNHNEKTGVEYAAAALIDCITLDDFQSKKRELTNLACTFMPTLGLKLK